jgi:hypothetical protein
VRRLLTAPLVALLVVGMLPLAAFAGVPEAAPQTVSTDEDTALPITLTATESSNVDVTAFTPNSPGHGSVIANGSIVCNGVDPVSCSQEFTYTPDQDYNGPDSFSFSAASDGSESPPATITITVDPVNDDPTFTVGADVTVGEDSGAYSDGSFITDGSPGPANETGTMGYTVEASVTDLFSAGPSISSSGGLTFTPAANAFGTTSVSVTADDGSTGTAGPQAFDITITADNDVPSFTKGSNVQVDVGDGAYGAPWATDIDPGPGESDTVSFVVEVLDDTLFTAQPAVDGTGQLTFTPGASAGSTSVTVKAVDDGEPPAESAQETFTITITDGPAAIADTVTVTEDTDDNPITLTGSDPQDDPLTFEVASGPTHGDLTGTAPDLLYTPDPNFYGTDSFTFTATDGVTTSPAATITITVDGVNDPVLARFDQVIVKATTTTVLDVFKANPNNADSAGAGEPISDVTITGIPDKPDKGAATITNGGTRITYDPKGCALGSDSFQYTISDGLTSSTATVTVTIARPGQSGFSSLPLTDAPAVGFMTGSTIGSTVPMKLSWCGVTTSSTSVRNYRVYQSTNGGSTYPTRLFDATTAKSSTRSLSLNKDYRWKAQTLDTAGRRGVYKASLVSRLTSYQNTNAAITYTGSWATSTTSSASGGSERYTSQTGAAATIIVTNVRSFAIIGPRSSTRGSFKVFLDGNLVTTVSERATTLVYRRVLYARGVTSGIGVSHTIRIESAGGGRIDLDAILTLK